MAHAGGLRKKGASRDEVHVYTVATHVHPAEVIENASIIVASSGLTIEFDSLLILARIAMGDRGF